jgi:DNA invertase Pin-like site-specific DNA recombinase
MSVSPLLTKHPETPLSEFRQFTANRGLQSVGEDTDHGFSGIRTHGPDLDRMMDDGRRQKFDALLVW